MENVLRIFGWQGTTASNIVKYHYFMREYFPKKKKHEFHIIMERIKGGDMEDRIRKYGCAKKIETIKEIGG